MWVREDDWAGHEGGPHRTAPHRILFAVETERESGLHNTVRPLWGFVWRLVVGLVSYFRWYGVPQLGGSYRKWSSALAPQDTEVIRHHCNQLTNLLIESTLTLSLTPITAFLCHALLPLEKLAHHQPGIHLFFLLHKSKTVGVLHSILPARGVAFDRSAAVVLCLVHRENGLKCWTFAVLSRGKTIEFI